MRPKIPAWKQFLSFFTEITLEKRESEKSGKLKVVVDRGRIKLNANSATYSFEDLYTCYRNTFNEIDLHDHPINQVLVLGYGLGSVPRLLDDRLEHSIAYTGIEHDRVIIELAGKYGYLNDKIELIEADAMEFIQKNQKQFDLIAVDLFLDSTVPARFQTVEFLELVLKATSPNGWILFNRLAYPEKELHQTATYFEEIFARVIPHVNYVETKGNWVLMGRR